jgi:hypothetical protein
MTARRAGAAAGTAETALAASQMAELALAAGCLPDAQPPWLPAVPSDRCHIPVAWLLK